MRHSVLALLPAFLWSALLLSAQGGFDSKGKEDKTRKLTDEE